MQARTHTASKRTSMSNTDWTVIRASAILSLPLTRSFSYSSATCSACWQRVRRSGVRNLAVARGLSLSQNVQTSSGAYPNSYPMGTEWTAANHLHLATRWRMSGATTLLPLYAFMVYTGRTIPFLYLYLDQFSWNVGRMVHTHKQAIPTVNPCIGPYRPWGFQEVEVPRFPGNRHKNMVRLPDLRTGRL